ncbi:MAG: hypothetical protein MUD08_01255, partial [Cytophagales bacterium]|nr:hypothetical protein [Cytophagales bacterium]
CRPKKPKFMFRICQKLSVGLGRRIERFCVFGLVFWAFSAQNGYYFQTGFQDEQDFQSRQSSNHVKRQFGEANRGSDRRAF